MTYKAIGFDYDGVIGGVKHIGGSFTGRVCQLLGIDEATYKELYFSLNHKINLGEVDNWREFWQIFLDRLGRPEMLEQLSALNEEAFKYLMDIDPAMLELIDTLRHNGYKVGLLSNATLENGRQMRAVGLDRHFDAFYISAEIKLMKPDPAAFQKLAQSLEVDMNELIFVDDAEKSLSTAKICGFTPILFIDHPSLVNQLQELNIKL